VEELCAGIKKVVHDLKMEDTNKSIKEENKIRHGNTENHENNILRDRNNFFK
jgi:hypothetical protein